MPRKKRTRNKSKNIKNIGRGGIFSSTKKQKKNIDFKNEAILDIVKEIISDDLYHNEYSKLNFRQRKKVDDESKPRKKENEEYYKNAEQIWIYGNEEELIQSKQRCNIKNTVNPQFKNNEEYLNYLMETSSDEDDEGGMLRIYRDNQTTDEGIATIKKVNEIIPGIPILEGKESEFVSRIPTATPANFGNLTRRRFRDRMNENMYSTICGSCSQNFNDNDKVYKCFTCKAPFHKECIHLLIADRKYNFNHHQDDEVTQSHWNRTYMWEENKYNMCPLCSGDLFDKDLINDKWFLKLPGSRDFVPFKPKKKQSIFNFSIRK